MAGIIQKRKMINFFKKLFCFSNIFQNNKFEKIDLGEPTQRSSLDTYKLIKKNKTVLLFKDLNHRHGIKLEGYEKFTREIISNKLTCAGIPIEDQEELIQFQLKYGGVQDNFRLNSVVWGILQTENGWMAKEIIESEKDDENKNIWHVVCADVHPSDIITIDQNGKLYWCWSEWYPHFEVYFSELFDKREQSAED